MNNLNGLLATPAYWSYKHDEGLFSISRTTLLKCGFKHLEDRKTNTGKMRVFTKKIHGDISLQLVQVYKEVTQDVFALQSCMLMLVHDGELQLKITGITDLQDLLKLIDKYLQK